MQAEKCSGKLRGTPRIPLRDEKLHVLLKYAGPIAKPIHFLHFHVFAVLEHFSACWLIRSSYSRFEMTGCLMECSVKIYPELYWFGNRFSIFFTKIRIPSRRGIPSAACNFFYNFPASMHFLQRNTTFSALNACSTCNLAAL